MREIDGYLLTEKEAKDCIDLIHNNATKISAEAIEILRHIFDARIDNSAGNYSVYIAWTSARDIIEYALADNIECLKQFDYLPTKEEVTMKENIEGCEQFGAALECYKEFLESHHLM